MAFLRVVRQKVLVPAAMALCVLVVFGCAAPAAPAPTAAPAKQAAPAPTAEPAKQAAPAPTKAPEKAAAPAEKYPARPIDFIVPWGAGGGADQLARKLGGLAEKELGVALPVLNVAGATGGTGAAKLLAAPADGYSIAVYIADSHANVASGAAAYSHKDFAPVIRAQLMPSFYFVKADSPYKTWADLEAYAKANPEKLRVGITGEGSLDEVTTAYIGSKGVKLNPVPYPNPGERYAALLGGHTELLYEQAGDVRQYLSSGEIRPLIIFSEKRMPEFKDVPASKELGYEIFLPQFRSIVAKKGTDPARVKVLADAFKKVTQTPDWATFAKEQYMTEDSFMGPEEVTAFLDREYETMVTLMKQLGLKTK